MQWRDRRFLGWIAFGGGVYVLPVHGSNEAAMDDHVQKLTQARLTKLPKQPALHKPAPIVADDKDDVEDSSGGVEGEDSSMVESLSSGMDDSYLEEEQESIDLQSAHC